MGDRAWASIRIGGDLPEGLCENFLDYIRDSGAGPEDEGGIDYLFTEYKGLSHKACLEQLLADCDGKKHLYLYDAEANYGSFPDLEKFLKVNQLSYDMHHSAGGEYDAGNEYHRPGQDDVCVVSSNHGDGDYIGASRVVQAREELYAGNFHNAIILLDHALEGLWRLPPLPPFRIVP